MTNSLPLGVTLSFPQLEYLQLSIPAAIHTALQFNFSHLRLGAYWSRIEKSPGIYNFAELHQVLDQLEVAHQPVVLTVGVKAPRWPEFYWPTFLSADSDANYQPPKANSATNHSIFSYLSQPAIQTQILNFIRHTISEFRSYDCLTHWQVENEPLDPSGPNHESIPADFLAEEINLVRQLDSRPIIVTLWGNQLKQRGFFPIAAQLADIVGLDLYDQQFVSQILGKSVYVGPSQSPAALAKIIRSTSKPVWITELQAEPWEKNEADYRQANPGSLSPAKLAKKLAQAEQLPVTEILAWGFEYWLWRAQQGDRRYLEMINQKI